MAGSSRLLTVEGRSCLGRYGVKATLYGTVEVEESRLLRQRGLEEGR